MESWSGPLGVAVALYIATNLDDALLVVALFADTTLRPAHVFAGQYLGMALLYGASLGASLLGLLVPIEYLGLLGLIPVLMGLAGLRELAWPDDDSDQKLPISTIARGGVFSVTAITVASGGDNIAVYVPAFAVMPLSERLLVGVVFALLVALWVGGAYVLTRHPRFGAPLRRYGRVALPITFIGIGVWVFFEAGTYRLLI